MLPTDYMAHIRYRIPGMAGWFLKSIFAARDMRTLTQIVLAQIEPGERVVYNRRLEPL